MELSREVEKIWGSPGEYLTEACALALGAFLFGYRMANAASGPILDALAQKFDGPEQADACTRAYLNFASSERALREVLDALRRLLAEENESERPPQSRGGEGFVDLIREPVISGRTGVVFAEPTVVWCANYWKGFLAGMAVTDAAAATRELGQFEAFEEWLGERYGNHRAPWYAMVRVYEGAGIEGLRAFVSLWDEFLRSPHL